MAIAKICWIDNIDYYQVDRVLSNIKSKNDFDWILFDESNYPTKKEAFNALISHLSTPSMFTSGKIIYVRAIPSFEKDLVEELNIADNTTFIIVDKIKGNSTSPLFKLVKDMLEKKQAKIMEADDFNQTNAVEWITARATALGVKIDSGSCRMLVEMFGVDRNRITMELRKLKNLSPDDNIEPWVIMKGAFGTGEADIIKTCDALLYNNEMAHEYLQRVLDKGEPPLRVCAFMVEWIRKLAIAESCNCNFESAKERVTDLKKQSEDGNKQILMYPKPGALYYGCRDYLSAKKKKGWAYRALRKFGDVQIKIRQNKDPYRVLHGYLAEIMEN